MTKSVNDIELEYRERMVKGKLRRINLVSFMIDAGISIHKINHVYNQGSMPSRFLGSFMPRQYSPELSLSEMVDALRNNELNEDADRLIANAMSASFIPLLQGFNHDCGIELYPNEERGLRCRAYLR